MATYTVRAPDGKLYDLEAPKGLSKSSLRNLAMAHFGAMQMPEITPPAPIEPQAESGFIPALKAGASGVYEDLATLAGRTGIISPETAEQVRAEQEAYQKRTFKPTEEGWSEAPWTKLKELAGGSLPYMVGPLGAGTLVRGAGKLAAMGATGAASSLQFTGSNLSRQIEEGKRLSETDVGSAFLASIPQAALDTLSLRMLPGLGKLLGSVGETMTEAQAKKILERNLKDAVVDYGLKTGKTAGIEGTTEAAQQVFERLQAGLNITDEAARKEYLENFIGGAVLGGALAVPGRFVERGQERAQAEDVTLGAQPEAPAQSEFAKILGGEAAPAEVPRETAPDIRAETGVQDVGQVNEPAGGAGAVVPEPTGNVTPAPTGTQPSDGTGVVSTGPNVAGTVEGEGGAPASVEDKVKEAVELMREGADSNFLRQHFSDEVITKAAVRFQRGLNQNLPPDADQEDFPDVPELGAKTEPAARTAATVQDEMRAIEEQRLALLSKNGRAPRKGTEKHKQWMALEDQHSKLIYEWNVLDKQERTAKTEAIKPELLTLMQELKALGGTENEYTAESLAAKIASEAERLQKPEAVIWQAALDRTRERIEEAKKAQAAPSEQTTTTEQVAPQVAPEVSQDVIDEFNASRDFHNEQADNAKRQIPAFNELTPAQQARVAEMTKDGSAASFDSAAATIADEVHGKAAPAVKETELPNQIKKQVENGNLLAAINYLKSSKDISPILREVAKRIGQLKLNTKLEFVRSLPDGRVAEYDPKADVIRVTEAGKTPQTILHELVHAASIKVLNEYSKAQNKLSDAQEDAADHLHHLMELTKDKLGGQFPDAYKNVYEFLSEAMTNEAFQSELNKIAIPRSDSLVPGEVSAWKNFIRSIAQLLGVDIASFQNGTSALLEAFQAFDHVVSAPKGGIDMAPLGSTMAAPVMPGQPASQRREGYKKQVQIKERGAKSLIKNLMSYEGYNLIVRKFANSREGIRRIQQVADRLGMVERLGPKLNNVYDQLTFSIGRGVNLFNSRMRYLTEAMEGDIGAYAEKRGISVNDALAELHLIFEARHEPERRMVKFLFSVPLDDTKKLYRLDSIMGDAYKDKTYSAQALRAEIKSLLAENKKYDEKTIAQLRSALETVVNDAKTNPDLRAPKTNDSTYDVNNANYSVIGDGVSAEGRSSDEIADIRKEFDRPEFQKEINAVWKSLSKVMDETKALNREANYWSQPVENISKFYGYKEYIPFKGRKGQRTIDEQLDIGSRLIGGEFQDMTNAFEGRKSESENPLLQVMADASGAALRAGRSDLTLAIKNAVDAGILKGEVNYIDFRDRYIDNVEKADLAGPGKIFHYEPDGRIAVINLTSAQEAEAIRRTYRTANPIIDTLDRYTSLMGQTHTRYNPAFGPVNFLTDLLTNAWNLGAKYGPAKSFQLIRQTADDIFFNGGIAKSAKFAYLSGKGNNAELNRLAGGTKPYDQLTKEQQYYRDLKEYVDMGGKVSYLQAVSARGAEEQLSRDLNRGKGTRAKEFVDEYVDMYNDTLELASRVGSYRALRSQYFAENKKSGRFKSDAEALADAKVKAAAEAKNLANFEQTGEWGKTAGALFMFFRPAATGAYRAIEAVMPALRLYGVSGTLLPGKGIIKEREEMFRAEYGQFLRNSNKDITEAEVTKRTDEALKQLKREAENARHMIMGLIGMGMMMYYMSYMMAGDDEEGRNKVATDDTARWTRNARFFVPWSDNPIQVRWGFGHGAFAAIGAQMAAMTMGRDSLATNFDNIRQIMMDNYLPLPISKINMFEKPLPFIADTLNPSLTRPLFEFVMNLDGLGRSIYNDRQSRYGDAYMGSDSTPSMYKDAARLLFDITNGSVDMNPNTMMFLASNYIDGMAQIASAGYGLTQVMSGKKDFDVRNEAPFIRGFVGAKSNIDAREFARVEDRIKSIEQKLNTMKESRPDMYDEYVSEHPDEADIVKYYNKQINRGLRKVRSQLNDVRAMPSDEITPRERKEQIDELMQYQNAIKRDLLLTFREDFGMKP